MPLLRSFADWSARCAASRRRLALALVVALLASSGLPGTGSLALGIAPARAEVLAATDRATYAAAFKAADLDRWADALSLAASAQDQTLAEVIAWRYLRSNDAQGADILERRIAFLDRHGDWPLMQDLQRQIELEFARRPRVPSRVIGFFDRHPPVSPAGEMALARAHLESGDRDRARAVARAAWVEANFWGDQEAEFLRALGTLLTTDDHLARADRLVWDRHYDDARAMLPRLDAGRRALITARIVLGTRKGDADAAVAAVPKELRADPGLVFERVRWRRRAGLDSSAIDLLEKRGTITGREDRWWIERAILLRDALERGQVALAYRLAAGHEQDQGTAFAEGEWLAGWIALRFQNNPGRALPHFQTLYEGVSTPISLSRGAYWSGRAAEAMGQGDAARTWYARAAEHPATFYGQLAAARLGMALGSLVPAKDPQPTEAERAALAKDPRARVARHLAALNRGEELLSFVLSLTDDHTGHGARALIAQTALDAGEPGTAVFFARRASLTGTLLVESGYPLPPDLAQAVLDRAGSRSLHPAVAFGVIRQESNFNPQARSPAGALGLMQLMPTTARLVCRQEEITFEPDRLTEDPAYNIRLGTRYLGDLMAQFGGSVVLSAAGYNAGPGRPIQWMKVNGDPRQMTVDQAVDWVEKIPFRETRNYVQRVVEGALIYRLRLGETLDVDAPERILTR